MILLPLHDVHHCVQRARELAASVNLRDLSSVSPRIQPGRVYRSSQVRFASGHSSMEEKKIEIGHRPGAIQASVT